MAWGAALGAGAGRIAKDLLRLEASKNLCQSVRVVPAVAVSKLVAVVSLEVTHRTVARDHDVADALRGPGARIGRRAHPGADPARFGERQHAFDYVTAIAVHVSGRRLLDGQDPGHAGDLQFRSARATQALPQSVGVPRKQTTRTA